MPERDDIQAAWFQNTNETEWRLDSQRKEIERLQRKVEILMELCPCFCAPDFICGKHKEMES